MNSCLSKKAQSAGKDTNEKDSKQCLAKGYQTVSNEKVSNKW